MKNKFMAIVDLEATCWESNSIEDKRYQRENSEIIEIGALLVSLDKDTYLDIIKEFNIFLKPTKHPILSDFCKNLTSISQKDVDKSYSFAEGISLFKKEIFQDPQTIFGSWGKYDFNFLKEQCEKKNVAIPFNIEKVVNLKSLVATIKGWKKRGFGINRSLTRFGLEFEGTSHRGLDDAKNVRRILLKVKDELRL